MPLQFDVCHVWRRDVARPVRRYTNLISVQPRGLALPCRFDPPQFCGVGQLEHAECLLVQC